MLLGGDLSNAGYVIRVGDEIDAPPFVEERVSDLIALQAPIPLGAWGGGKIVGDIERREDLCVNFCEVVHPSLVSTSTSHV